MPNLTRAHAALAALAPLESLELSTDGARLINLRFLPAATPAQRAAAQAAAAAYDLSPAAEATRDANDLYERLAQAIADSTTEFGAVLDALVTEINARQPPGQAIALAALATRVRGRKK